MNQPNQQSDQKTANQMLQQEKKAKRGDLIQKYLIVIILIAMVIALSVLNPAFLSVNNILNLLTQTSIYGILSLAVFVVIVTQGIDLSLGSVLAFAGVVAAVVSQSPDAIDNIFPGIGMAPIWVTVLVAVGVGGLLGAINGILIAYFNLPAFISTLGMFTAARGGALLISSGRPVSSVNPAINFFGRRLFGFLPVPVIVFAIVIIFIGVLMNYTSYGKSIYAIGGNIDAAKVSGIKVQRNLTFAYVIAGSLAGLAAIVYMGRTGGSIQPAAATGYELTAIAGATIGGTSHSGGIGTVWGAVVGALILGVLVNGFTLLGIDAYIQQIVQGALIVGAVLVDMRKNA